MSHAQPPEDDRIHREVRSAQERRRRLDAVAAVTERIIAAMAAGRPVPEGLDNPFEIPVLVDLKGLHEGGITLLSGDGHGPATGPGAVPLLFRTFSTLSGFLEHVGRTLPGLVVLDVDCVRDGFPGRTETVRDAFRALEGRHHPPRIVLLRTSRTVASWAMCRELIATSDGLVAGTIPSFAALRGLIYELRHSSRLEDSTGPGRLRADPHVVLGSSLMLRRFMAGVSSGAMRLADLPGALGLSHSHLENSFPTVVWPEVVKLVGTESLAPNRAHFNVLIRLAADLEPWFWPWLADHTTRADADLLALRPN